MPIQVLAGLPWLAGILGGFFTTIFQFFAQYLTKRLAVVAAAVTAIATLTTAMFASLSALTSSIAVALPDSIVIGAGLIVPDNAIPSISVVLSAHMIRYVYDWNVKIIQLRLL
jgi:hypothetical protein